MSRACGCFGSPGILMMSPAMATIISAPALIAFIMFNITTIPCFAAVATAKAELPKGKFAGTLLFWLVTRYVVGTMVYTVGSWWWTAFLWLAAAVAAGAVIALRNRGIIVLPALRKRRS